VESVRLTALALGRERRKTQLTVSRNRRAAARRLQRLVSQRFVRTIPIAKRKHAGVSDAFDVARSPPFVHNQR